MPYTAFDRFVARQRFRAVLPHVIPGAKVCDLGCGLDAAFLTFAGSRIAWGVGLDDQVGPATSHARWPVVCADITRPLPLADAQFDHVLMLAVLEHLRDPDPVLCEAFRILRPGGSLLLTWPRAIVDPLLNCLHRVGLVSKEMESQEHQHRIPIENLLRMLEQIGFEGFTHRAFELGLNNLLIACKPPGRDEQGVREGLATASSVR
jgi:SAM-dependent methyltransferase